MNGSDETLDEVDGGWYGPSSSRGTRRMRWRGRVVVASDGDSLILRDGGARLEDGGGGKC